MPCLRIFVLIVDNTFIILRNKVIAQRGFEVIKDARCQGGLINHVSIEGIECKIRTSQSSIFSSSSVLVSVK